MKMYTFCLNEQNKKYANLYSSALITNEMIYINNMSYILYGWTNDKKVFNLFKKQRNMDIFTIIVLNLDNNKNTLFSEKYKYNEITIEVLGLTHDYKYYKKIAIIHEEYMCMKSTCDDFYIIISGLYYDYINKNIFKSKYVKILDNIKYFKMINISKKVNDGEDISIVDDLYSEYEIFLYMYSDLLNPYL